MMAATAMRIVSRIMCRAIALPSPVAPADRWWRLCGKVWVPKRDPSQFPVCPDCKRIYDEMMNSNF